MMRTTLCAVIILAIWRSADAQPAASGPVFEVASVKPNASGSGSSNSRFPREPRGGFVGFTATNNSLKQCIKWAYGVKDYQISGPDWLDSQRYDIVTRTADPVSAEQVRAMLQALLADRFKLILHREQKSLPVYALMVGKKGPNLRAAEAGASQTRSGRGHLSAKQTSMLQLAEILSQRVDRPVLDMTGLTGFYDFQLEWAPEDSQPAVDTRESASIFTAVQEQLGLKVEAKKAPVDILVIDHAERVPAEN